MATAGEGGEGVGGVQADCLITGGSADWSDRSSLGSGGVDHGASHLVLKLVSSETLTDSQ